MTTAAHSTGTVMLESFFQLAAIAAEIDGQHAARLGFGRAGQRRDRGMQAGIVGGHDRAFMAVPGWSV